MQVSRQLCTDKPDVTICTLQLIEEQYYPANLLTRITISANWKRFSAKLPKDQNRRQVTLRKAINFLWTFFSKDKLKKRKEFIILCGAYGKTGEILSAFFLVSFPFYLKSGSIGIKRMTVIIWFFRTVCSRQGEIILQK